MDFQKFMKDFADAINGQYSEYDNQRAVIIIPLKDDRFQAVVGTIVALESYDKKVVEFSSRVCETTEKINYEKLLFETKNYIHVKFIIDREDGYLKAASSTFLDLASVELLKEIIIEVAYVADEWEYKITGEDVN